MIVLEDAVNYQLRENNRYTVSISGYNKVGNFVPATDIQYKTFTPRYHDTTIGPGIPITIVAGIDPTDEVTLTVAENDALEIRRAYLSAIAGLSASTSGKDKDGKDIFNGNRITRVGSIVKGGVQLVIKEYNADLNAISTVSFQVRPKNGLDIQLSAEGSTDTVKLDFLVVG